MKALCVMDSISRSNGGIFEAERRLQQTLHAQLGLEVHVVGLRDAQTESDLAAWSPLNPVACAVKGPQAFGYAPEMTDVLIKANADVGYFVGLWKFPSVAALRWAKQTGKPFMVAPHGMLDPWAVRNSGAKKRVAAWLFQNAQLRKAACLRALCIAEAESIRAYGLNNPICVIPNGIDLPVEGEGSKTDSPFPADRKVVLYLGRLHPKKGLANLLKAWSREEINRGRDGLLVIAGWDQGGHEAVLKQQATDLNIPWEEGATPSRAGTALLFPGPQFGEIKAKFYRHCDAFILPSFSEGLPMVILEAWAYGKPVLMTPECNLPEGFATRAALRMEPSADGVSDSLKQLFAMSVEDREAMGRRGIVLVNERFVWSKVAVEMMSVYRWMLGAGNKPDCVISS